MSLKTQVAFLPSEWRRVRELYNSQEIRELKEALAILNMWKSRMSDRTALFIPCTEMILSCRLEEKQLEMTPDPSRHESFKMTMGGCVIRIVNFANELAQARNKTYVKMAIALAEVGVPSWMVDVRHQVSHAVEYPSMHTLKKCLEFATEWLWNRIWKDPQHDFLAFSASTDSTEWERSKAQNEKLTLIMTSLQKFMRWRMNDVKQNQLVSYDQEALNTLPQLQEIRKFVETDYEDFLDILLSDGFLILSKEQAENGQFLDAIEIVQEIRTNWQIYWAPIISLLMQHNLIPDFLLKMLDKVKDEKLSLLSRDQLVAWCKLVIDGFSTTSTQFTNDDWRRILTAIISLPWRFDQKMIKSVMAMIPNMKRKQRKDVIELWKVSTDGDENEIENVKDSPGQVHTVDEISNLIQQSSSQQSEKSSPDLQKPGGRWKRCDPNQWMGVPLGLCPGQTAESLSLIMDEEYLNRLRMREEQN